MHVQVGELGPVVLQVELETLGQLLRNRGLERMSHNKPLLRTLAVITALVGITLLVSAAVQTILALTLSTTEFVGSTPVVRWIIYAAGAVADRVVRPASPVAARSRPRRRPWRTARPHDPAGRHIVTVTASVSHTS